jgi:ZF-HD class homeobox domain-containing protein
VKNSITLFSNACGMHNCGSATRKPMERSSQKLKRTRTRISLEQREKLNAFAEKAGWTVVGQRKETIDAACQYIGTL